MAVSKPTSKKQSDASSKSQQPPSSGPVFFLDRDLGRYDVAKRLRELGARVEVHVDHFPPNAPDTEWLPEVGSRGWVILTRDRHIKTRALEVIALLKANTHAFILNGKHELSGQDMANAFATAFSQMCRLVAKHTPPFLANVTPKGNIHKIEGYAKIVERIRESQKHFKDEQSHE